ncbi:carbohydrate sulfotransferase 15-like [Watersipora subatra]|uniref:carbohydrate sulfotransferase 15-like n=1 Tax=Watersipora subatra TaxID=2589382 RepID=UPI00355C1758
MYRLTSSVKTALILLGIMYLTLNVTLHANRASYQQKHYREKEYVEEVVTVPPIKVKKPAAKVDIKTRDFENITSKLRSETWDSMITNDGLKVSYAPLDKCSKPPYIPAYKALCYNMSDAKGAKGAEVKCTPNHYLLGIRKCGTTDVIKWFQYHADKTEVQVKGHKLSPAIGCPEDLVKRQGLKGYPKSDDVMSYAPGDLLFSRVTHRNSTHLTIQTALQYVAFLSVPGKSKFIVTLRNPTDRLLSYLYHAKRQRWIYTGVSKENFHGSFLHLIVLELVSKVTECLSTHGELACVYMYDSSDGNLQAVIQHGFYVVYLTELFRFIPREDVYISQLEEYSKNQLDWAEKIMAFFGKELRYTDGELSSSKKRMNVGTERQVLPETIELLDNLYRPLNRRLAVLLNDDKWLYDRREPTSGTLH